MKILRAQRFFFCLFFISAFYCLIPRELGAENEDPVIEIKIPAIGINKALLHHDKKGITIIEVDKLGPMRWIMRSTRILSITFDTQTIQMDDEWNISTLIMIKPGNEIFIHFLPPGEINENKIETRQVDIRFSVYMTPDYTDYSLP